MSDNPDTIDTIVDDMLNEGHTGPADSLEWVQAKMKFYAERIKEAWKRQCSQSWHHREMEELILRHEKEVAELKNQTGNAAAMHKALERCRALAETIWQSKGGEDVSAEIAELKDLISAALAAPPRNCDVYPTVAEARNAFICEPCEHPCGDCTVCDDDYALCRPCGIKWLFAPAKKGTAK